MVATKATRVRTIQMFASVSVPFGESPGETVGEDYHTWQDDIRLIGCSLSMAMKVVGALTEGRCNGHAQLMRGAISDVDSIIAEVTPWVGYWTEIVVAQQCAGCFGIPSTDMVLMFPPGYGIDFNEGDPINLFVYSGSTIISAGTLDIDSECHLYYVER